MDDLKFLAKAKVNHRGQPNSYWRQAFEEHFREFPIIGVLQGPMLRSGLYYSQSQADRVAHPYPLERAKGEWQGMYSRAAFEADVAYFEETRALLRENFILGQQDEGPYLDGLVFLKADQLLLAEIKHCEARLRTTSAILQASRMAKPKAEEKWRKIGNDSAVAIEFKKSGHEVRSTGLYWEVRLK